MDITVEIAILGFGREGKAVLKFLRKTPQFKNADISILDKKLNKDYLNNLDLFSFDSGHPVILQSASRRNLFILGTLSFFFPLLAQNHPFRVFGKKNSVSNLQLFY